MESCIRYQKLRNYEKLDQASKSLEHSEYQNLHGTNLHFRSVAYVHSSHAAIGTTLDLAIRYRDSTKFFFNYYDNKKLL